AALDLAPEILFPFVGHWQNEAGQSIDVANNFQWEPSMGDMVMHATWNGLTTCSVTHHMVFEPLFGDFDLSGAVGTSDVLPLLSEISCVEACSTDLNEDGTVGIGDLLLLLALVGQTCD
ncbi:MAG: hypothetical protein VX758_07290, partial [Bacteroidota bacterium]|nr:hypothetical protein [Bacteroidota bacterium]